MTETISQAQTGNVIAVEEKKKKLQVVFSFVSGEVFEVEEDEVKNLEKYQIALKKRPLSHCKKCYGRGHLGFNLKTNVYLPCLRCMRACVDLEKLDLSANIELNELP